MNKQTKNQKQPLTAVLILHYKFFNLESHTGNALPWVSKSHFIKFYHLSWTTSTHPNPHLTPNPELASPALWAALTGSLREGSRVSFHPLLEDKHQSHLTAHPYSWAAYKYLIAALLQLFSWESNINCLACVYIYVHIYIYIYTQSPFAARSIHMHIRVLYCTVFSFKHLCPLIGDQISARFPVFQPAEPPR